MLSLEERPRDHQLVLSPRAASTQPRGLPRATPISQSSDCGRQGLAQLQLSHGNRLCTPRRPAPHTAAALSSTTTPSTPVSPPPTHRGCAQSNAVLPFQQACRRWRLRTTARRLDGSNQKSVAPPSPHSHLFTHTTILYTLTHIYCTVLSAAVL